MGKFRDGMAVTGEAVSLILAAIDRIKTILDGLEKLQREPPGDDADLIGQLNRAAAHAQETNLPWQDDGSAACERASDEVAPESGDGAALHNFAESGEGGGSVASQSIRVSIDTLDQLMTMVSELVLTRNQLLEVLRRHDDSEFNVPLQRCRASRPKSSRKCGSRHRESGPAKRGGQTATRHHSADRFSPRRLCRDRNCGRRPRPRYGAH